jgi:hypothetical protein
MALTAGTQAFLRLYAQQAANPSYGAGGDAEVRVEVEYGSGAGDRLAEALHFSSRTLAGAAAESIDLTTILDANGDALAAAQVMIFCLEADESNVDAVRLDVGNAVANSWTALVSASGAVDQARLDIQPGAVVPLISWKNGAYPVSGTSKVVQVTNLDATTDATYRLFVLASRS